MLDLKNVDVKALRNDLIKNAVIIVFARLVRYYLLENHMSGVGDVSSALPTDFVYGLVFTLLGFVFFHVVVSPAVSQMQ